MESEGGNASWTPCRHLVESLGNLLKMSHKALPLEEPKEWTLLTTDERVLHPPRHLLRRDMLDQHTGCRSARTHSAQDTGKQHPDSWTQRL